MPEQSRNHSVHRIVLPSGRKIEVIRFHDGIEERETGPLHICPECQCDLVQPVSWSESSQDNWELLLRCPNCEWTTEGIYGQSAVEELEEIDRFLAALEADLILPEDF